MDVNELIFIALVAMPTIAHPFDSFDCGVANFDHSRQHRLVGGTNVFGWKYPWYGALIHTKNGHLACGANLISSKHLLTAAHCYDDYQSEDEDDNKTSIEAIYDVHLGTMNWCLPNRRRQIFQIETVHIHPKYFDFTQSNLSADVAVIVLKTQVRDIRPICLPFNGEHSHLGHVLGFGLTQFKLHSVVCVLREIFVDIFTASECRQNDNPTEYNSQDTICAGKTAGGIDACQGDSGGLLQIKTSEKKHFIVGIVSFGDACALRNRPGIYTNVSYHLSWILDVCNSQR